MTLHMLKVLLHKVNKQVFTALHDRAMYTLS